MSRSRLLLPLLLAATAAAVGLVAILSWVRVPEGTVGIRSSRWGRPPAVLSPGSHLRIPGLESVGFVPYPRVELGGTVPATTPEGLRILLPYRFSLQTRTTLLLARAGAGETAWPEAARAALAGAWKRRLREIGTAGLLGPEGKEELRAAAVEALGPLGLEVASLEIGAPEARDEAGRDALRRLRIRAGLDRSVRIVLVGWDGADWGIAGPLIEAGRMPNLARLRERAAWGRMRSGSPTLSPLLWTTVATGKRPEEHGIVDFLVRDPGSGRYVPISSNFRRVKALWNIFTEFDLPSAWIAWWATWPAERVRGEMVTDRVAYSLFPGVAAAEGAGLTHPEELFARLGPLLRSPEEVGPEEIGRYVEMAPEAIAAALGRPPADGSRYSHPLKHLQQVLASTTTYHRIALRLFDEEPPHSLFAVYYQGIDEVCHRFAHYLPPRMERLATGDDYRRYRETVPRFYAWQDRLLGELLDRVGDDAYILLLSDHGFAHGSERPLDVPPDIEGRPGKWHTPDGIWLLAGPEVVPGRRKPATLYQIAPTLLALAGLPAADDMPGRPLEGTPARAGPAPGGPAAAAIASVPTYEGGGGRSAGPAPTGGASAAVEEEMLEKLRSLGYIEGTGTAGGGEGRPDAGTTLYHSNLAASYMLGGDFAAARREFERALELQPESVPALTGMSELAARQGEPLDALQWARRAVAAGLDVDPPFYIWTAELFLKADLAEDGRDYFLDLYRYRSGISEIAVGLGLLYAALGDPESAEGYYRAGLATEPACLVCLQELFELLDRRGEADRLEEPIREALALGVREVLPWNWLGLIYKRQGRFDESEAAFRACLEEYPEHSGTLANLGALYLEQDRPEEAVEVLERGWSLDPRRREVLVNLLVALFRSGRPRDAEERFREVEASGTPHTSIYNAMAWGYHFSGMPDRAGAMARASLEIDPDQPQVRSLLEAILGGGPAPGPPGTGGNR